jgi:hypothetical protein
MSEGEKNRRIPSGGVGYGINSMNCCYDTRLPLIWVKQSPSTGACAPSVVLCVLVALLYVGLARWLSAAVCCAYSPVQPRLYA